MLPSPHRVKRWPERQPRPSPWRVMPCLVSRALLFRLHLVALHLVALPLMLPPSKCLEAAAGPPCRFFQLAKLLPTFLPAQLPALLEALPVHCPA